MRALAGAALFGDPVQVRSEVEHIANLYAQAARAAQATARQIDSVTTQLDTLARMLQALAPARDRHAVQAAEALRDPRADHRSVGRRGTGVRCRAATGSTPRGLVSTQKVAKKAAASARKTARKRSRKRSG